MPRGRPVDPVHLPPPPPPRPNRLRDARRALARNKWLLAGSALTGLLLGLGIAFVETPMYRASASLEVRGVADSAVVQDEAALDKVIARLAVDRHPNAIAGLGVLDRVRRALGRQPATMSHEAVVAAAQTNLAAHQSQPGALLDISFDAADPQLASTVANAVADELIEQDINARLEEVHRWKAAYENSTAQLQDFLETSGLLIDPATGSTIAELKLRRVKEDLSRESSPWRENRLKQRYAEQSKIVGDEAPRAEQYSALKHDADRDRAAYEAAQEKAREPGKLRVVRSAVPPLHPYTPRTVWSAVIGLSCGLFVGLALVLVREKTDRSFRVPGDIKAYLNLTELGAIPSAGLEPVEPVSKRKDFTIDLEPGDWPRSDPSKGGGRDRLETVSCSNETSPIAESFRSALASLWLSGRNGKQPRVFVFTSPNAREGKTTLTSNLGIALANSNRRVLLIDGDIRKPRLHAVFNLSNGWGLGNLLEEDCPIEDYLFEDLVTPTAIPGLFVLPAGAGEVNVSSLRFHERLAELILRFRLEFHAVLLDTPPMLEFSDARILGRLSDGVIMVLRASETSRDDALAVYSRFREDGTLVLGSILNDWNPKKSKYSYGYRTSGVYGK